MKQEVVLNENWRDELKDVVGKYKRIVINTVFITPYVASRAFHGIFPENKDYVVVQCYGRIEIWPERKRAIAFYQQGAFSCEGSEQERYHSILYYLESNKRFAFDE